MLREQVLIEWNNLKTKLMSTITALKKLPLSNKETQTEETLTPDELTFLNNLQDKVKTKEQETIQVQTKLNELRAKNTHLTSYDFFDDTSDPAAQEIIKLDEQANKLYGEIGKWEKQLAQKKEELAAKYPLWAQQQFTDLTEQLLELKKELWARNQIVSDNYQAPHWKDDEQDYLQRLNIQQIKYIDLERKLEKVRDLLSENKLDRLKSLYKRGEI